MDFTEDNINGWNDSLSDAGMSPEKRGQAIALIQMLHATDPNLWNFENCDRLIAGLVQATVNNENIEEILINMAQAANAPVGSPTILKVERYRKTFLYLLAAGVSFATLQTMAPGVISFILDATYALFQALLKSNSPQEIAQQAISVSPLSAGSMAQAIAVSSTNLVTAAFYTCADIASRCATAGISAAASVVSQNYAACLRYGTELLSFAVATRVVPPVVEKASKAVKSVAEVAAGSADEKIAQWIDTGGPEKVQAAIAAAGAAAVENTKRLIGQSIDDIDEINRAMTDDINRAPNRFIGPTINEMINYALQTNVEKFRGDYRAALGELISDLSQIDFSLSPNDNENPDVLGIMQKYRIGWDNEDFRALIAVWKLAVEKKDIKEEAQSQPEFGSEDWVHPAVVNLKRSYSVEDRKAFPVNPHDPSATRYSVKSTEQIGPQRPFPSLKVESPVIDKLQKLLNRYNLLNRPFPKGSYFAGDTVYSVLSREREDVQQALLKVLEKEESRDPSILQLSPVEKKNAIKANKLRYLAAIENFLHPTINIEVSEEEMETDLGGSRRRGRKSRHYRKKRSTLKRRGLKRRYTRKGKKRRHTKKRR